MVSESDGVDLVAAPVQRMEGGGLNSQILFHDVSLQFNCGSTTSQGGGGGGGGGGQQRRVDGDPGQKTRGLSDFIQEKVYSDEREQFFRTHSEEFRRRNQNWNGEGSASEDGSEGDEDDEEEEEDEDDDDEGDGEVEGLVAVEDGNNNKINNNNSSGSIHSSSNKLCNEKRSNLLKLHSLIGSSRGGGVIVKDGSIIHSANNIRGSSSEQQHQEGRVSSYENSVTIAEPDTYYSQFLQGSEGGVLFHKVIGGENGCGGSGRKDLSFSKESGDSLRAILSDPMTGSLMDDAMILPCGHSFGSGGMQHVVRMKTCYTCSQPVSEDSMAPNLSLRSAVQAFRREEELQSQQAPKRRRERFELNKSSNPDPFSMDRMDHSRGKGVHFPFSVTDRVIIKGNKRTPLRFVGREAVVTTQCLNGWYVVKTLDNAESVKLQYRSLAKASDTPSSNITSSKAISTWI